MFLILIIFISINTPINKFPILFILLYVINLLILFCIVPTNAPIINDNCITINIISDTLLYIFNFFIIINIVIFDIPNIHILIFNLTLYSSFYKSKIN